MAKPPREQRLRELERYAEQRERNDAAIAEEQERQEASRETRGRKVQEERERLLRRLRTQARKLGVQRYAEMGRDELLEAIRAARAAAPRKPARSAVKVSWRPTP